METLSYISAGSVITPGETNCYVLLMTVFAFVGLSKSCLVNSFSFSCYWGFKGLLQSLSVTEPFPESTLILYCISGVAIFVLVNLYYFDRDRIPKKDLPENSEKLFDNEATG